MSAILPQFDPDIEERQALLGRSQSVYRYNHTHVSPLALLDRVPFEQEFSAKWLLHVGKNVSIALANRLELEGEKPIAELFRSKVKALEHVIGLGTGRFMGVVHEIVTEMLRFQGRSSATPNRAKSMEDFAAMFRCIGLPPVSSTTGQDMAFAHMRVAGPNPVMLTKVDRLDGRIPYGDAQYREAMPGDSLAASIAEGRLFLADYRELAHIEGAVGFDGIQKYMYAPLALFAIDRSTKRLHPVAIQCRQTPSEDNPVFTPDDGHNWMIAKTIVEIADGNIHEAVTHLGRTHLLMEPFVISTFRQLAANHPVFLLLLPHFEGTLAINEAAWRHLISDKGAVARLLGGTIEQSRALSADGVRSCHFQDAALPRSLRAQGLDDNVWLADYPYRDDAMLYWDAIARWVLDYLSLYYPSDEEVGRDVELLAWIDEIGDKDGGRIRGFERAPTPTIAGLAETLTMIIYTCSVQHAAVNFPQYSLMSYTPRMPLAGYAPAPRTKKGATPEDLLAILPPLDLAELQMELGYILGTVHYTTLGHYRADQFADPRVAVALARFQDELDEIGGIVAERNTTRTPYQFLVRSGIPQSINI
jgi:arachidonate 15-lipoxygenase